MGAVAELRKRSNRFVEQLPLIIQDIINDNQALIDLNRKQLKDEHMTTKDRLIEPKYSSWYAQIKGFDTPDLYATGELQRTLRIEATSDQNYYIDGTTDYTPKLLSQYGEEIFGIAISKQAQAKQITTSMISDLYKKMVING